MNELDPSTRQSLARKANATHKPKKWDMPTPAEIRRQEKNLQKAKEGQAFLDDATAYMVFAATSHYHDAIWRKPDGTLWWEQYVEDVDYLTYDLQPTSEREIRGKLSAAEIARATPPHTILYGEI